MITQTGNYFITSFDRIFVRINHITSSTMALESLKPVKNYIFHIMCYIVKICLRTFSKISQIALMKWCWIFMVTMTIYIVLTWNPVLVEKNTHDPVILWWTSSFPGTSETRHCLGQIKCDIFSDRNVSNQYNIEAYLFYGSKVNFNDMPLPRRPNDIMWGLYHEESPRNVEEMMHEEILGLFNYSSTFSRHSDVPFPLQYLQSIGDVTNTRYFVPTAEKNKLLKDIAPVMYLQTDCETSTERDNYVKELMKLIKIDSYGACLKNKEIPSELVDDYLNKLNDDAFLKFVARYKFVLAIENGVCDDYVTEKFWRAVRTGVVPIYFGSPSIRDWFPNKDTALLLEDFPTPKLMSDRIAQLLANDSLYESYLDHKTRKVITNGKLLEEFERRPYQSDTLKTAEEFECFVCKKLHQMRNKVWEQNVVNRKHYDCPKPISALTLRVNPVNFWTYSYDTAKRNAASILRRITNAN